MLTAETGAEMLFKCFILGKFDSYSQNIEIITLSNIDNG